MHANLHYLSIKMLLTSAAEKSCSVAVICMEVHMLLGYTHNVLVHFQANIIRSNLIGVLILPDQYAHMSVFFHDKVS